MKKSLLLVLAFALFTTAFAAPKKYKLLKNTTNWTLTSNWSPVGVPKDGDTILIPSGLQLVLGNDITLKDIYIDLYGSVVLSGNNMKAKFTGKSIVNLHTGATLYGSKNSQQVELGGMIYKGGQAVLAGPMMATAISSGFKPYIEFNILPVKFTSFAVTRSNNVFIVQWTTTEEVNAAYYEVQRSDDGNTWKAVVTLNATGNTTNKYSYTDRSSVTATVHYRIKQVDADGAFIYTEVRTLKNTTTTAPVIASAPNKIIVQFPQVVKGNVLVEVVGLNGHIAMQQTVTDATGNLQIATSLKGIYIVRLSNGQNLNTAKQIIL